MQCAVFGISGFTCLQDPAVLRAFLPMLDAEL